MSKDILFLWFFIGGAFLIVLLKGFFAFKGFNKIKNTINEHFEKIGIHFDFENIWFKPTLMGTFKGLKISYYIQGIYEMQNSKKIIFIAIYHDKPLFLGLRCRNKKRGTMDTVIDVRDYLGQKFDIPGLDMDCFAKDKEPAIKLLENTKVKQSLIKFNNMFNQLSKYRFLLDDNTLTVHFNEVYLPDKEIIEAMYEISDTIKNSGLGNT